MTSPQVASHTASPPARVRGFTLIELLVALAAMALMAGLSWRGLDGMVRAQSQIQQRADAVLTLQAGRNLAVRLWVQPTPNPNFLRVEAQVLDGEARILALSTVVGRY